MTQEQYGMWLCSIEGIGSHTIQKLIKAVGTPEKVYEKTLEELERIPGIGEKEAKLLIQSKRHFRYRSMKEQVKAHEMEVVSYFYRDYPEKCRQISDFPKRLYFKGKLPEEDLQIAIVGARNCSHYGREMARKFAYELARENVGIVSGMARGIDGWAHQGALEAGGNTYAVLGNSAEICYPKEHEKLYRSILKRGGVLSEYPPETPAMPAFFPMRNRIISALSDGVLIVEVRAKSGSLITADFAAEQGKQVLAVPGRPEDELSPGCNDLIAHGAGIILSEESMVKELCPDYKQKKRKLSEDIVLAPVENLVYSSLDLHSKSLWELEECLPLSLADLSNGLLSLEMKGLIRETEHNFYARR